MRCPSCNGPVERVDEDIYRCITTGTLHSAYACTVYKTKPNLQLENKESNAMTIKKIVGTTLYILSLAFAFRGLLFTDSFLLKTAAILIVIWVLGRLYYLWSEP